MNVLIGMECSGVVREAFRALGHYAVSCDLKPATDGSRHHIQDDVFEVVPVIGHSFDLGIFHPDCTYLSVSGLHWNHRRPERAALTEAAVHDFMRVWNFPIERVAVENPVGCMSTRFRKPNQTIQPYEFGDDASKKTCLWLRELPLLIPTRRIVGRMSEWPQGSGVMRERWSNQTDSGQNRLGPSEDRAAIRAVTYQGIADAMASQWGSL